MSEAFPGTSPLIEAAALAALLGDPALRIVDARFAPPTVVDPDAGRRGHAESHLPGATYADLNRDLSDLTRRGQGRHPLPDS
ncbi:sulfurtransferase, partial [Xanthomonas sp. Kuri4-2]